MMYSSGYEPVERSALQMNPVTSHRQGGNLKSSDSLLECLVKSQKDISNSSMGQFLPIWRKLSYIVLFHYLNLSFFNEDSCKLE